MLKNIYIAKDYDENILGIVLSPDADKAAIAFSARGLHPHSTEEINPDNDMGVAGVCFILSSEVDYKGTIKYIRGF